MFFFQNLTAELLLFESPDDSYFPKSGGSTFLKTVGSHFSEICVNKVTAYKSYETMCELSRRLRIHRPRTKFIDVQKANLAFRKQRKHSKSQTRKMIRGVLSETAKDPDWNAGALRERGFSKEVINCLQHSYPDQDTFL